MPPGPGLAGAGDGGPEIRELLRRLWGYKWLIAAVIALVVGSTWLVVEQIVPRYTSTAVLLIAPSEKNVIELKDVVPGLDSNPQTIRSEVIVLETRDLSAKAVEKLGLYYSPRLNSPRKRKSFFAHLNPLTYVPQEWSEGLSEFWRDAKASVLSSPAPVGEPIHGDPEQARRNAIVSQFMARLSVSREEFTKVIRISFTFEDPKLAADAANALADVYVQNTLEVKYAGTREAAVWLSEQLNTLRQQVEESEAALERVRQGEARVQGRSTILVSDEISALNSELLKAKSETTRLRARLRQIEELRKSSDWAEQSATIFRSDMIQTLRLEQFKLEREEADLSVDLGDDHPMMINIRAEIAGVVAKLQRELEQFVEAARDELAEAKTRENTLKRSLDSMTNQVGDVNEAEMRMRALEREAQANRNLYDAFLVRYKETSIQGEVQQPDARVIGYAQVTNLPSYPPKKRYMNTAIVLSLGLALALVFGLEKLDNGFRTARQVEQQTGLPVLGLIPSVKLNREHAKHAEDLITKNSHTRFTESINILYSHLKWPREGGIQNIILVTSAMPKEGKTSTAISLARRAAFLGDKTLLIDLDFHHPFMTQRLGLQTSPGIAEVVTKEASLEEALQRDEASGAFVLSCGKPKTDPVALIGSERFRELLTSFKETFDLVVLDTSPILAVAVPAILARTVDQTLVLIRWGKTPRSASLAAVKQLRDVGVRIAGVTLTQVDLTRQSYYGYGEYGYYTKQMKDYYTS